MTLDELTTSAAETPDNCAVLITAESSDDAVRNTISDTVDLRAR